MSDQRSLIGQGLKCSARDTRLARAWIIKKTKRQSDRLNPLSAMRCPTRDFVPILSLEKSNMVDMLLLP